MLRARIPRYSRIAESLRGRILDGALPAGRGESGIGEGAQEEGHALRGYTVVVAQDGISAEPEFPITLTRWQLLNQPGFTNADNKPLAKGMVTLSTTDQITFK